MKMALLYPSWRKLDRQTEFNLPPHGPVVFAATEPPGDRPAGAWFGLIAGAAAASETMLAADMASLFPHSEQLRVRPMLGDTGAGNLATLLADHLVDLAFVSTAAMAGDAAKTI